MPGSEILPRGLFKPPLYNDGGGKNDCLLIATSQILLQGARAPQQFVTPDFRQQCSALLQDVCPRCLSDGTLHEEDQQVLAKEFRKRLSQDVLNGKITHVMQGGESVALQDAQCTAVQFGTFDNYRSYFESLATEGVALGLDAVAVLSALLKLPIFLYQQHTQLEYKLTACYGAQNICIPAGSAMHILYHPAANSQGVGHFEALLPLVCTSLFPASNLEQLMRIRRNQLAASEKRMGILQRWQQDLQQQQQELQREEQDLTSKSRLAQLLLDHFDVLRAAQTVTTVPVLTPPKVDQDRAAPFAPRKIQATGLSPIFAGIEDHAATGVVPFDLLHKNVTEDINVDLEKNGLFLEPVPSSDHADKTIKTLESFDETLGDPSVTFPEKGVQVVQLVQRVKRASKMPPGKTRIGGRKRKANSWYVQE